MYFCTVPYTKVHGTVHIKHIVQCRFRPPWGPKQNPAKGPSYLNSTVLQYYSRLQCSIVFSCPKYCISVVKYSTMQYNAFFVSKILNSMHKSCKYFLQNCGFHTQKSAVWHFERRVRMNRYDKGSDSKNNSVEMHGFQFLPVAATGIHAFPRNYFWNLIPYHTCSFLLVARLIVTKFKMAANAKLQEDTVCIVL